MAACTDVPEKDAPMNTHCYSVGERVLYTRQRISHLSWKAPYTVTRCLASDQMEPQYEIRSAHGAYQRLASEHELTRMAVPAQAFHPAEALSPLDFFSPNEAANLNLLPAAGLPRRAWHKNERPSSRHG
jgi:hypothetical protein